MLRFMKIMAARARERQPNAARLVQLFIATLILKPTRDTGMDADMRGFRRV